jgi:hypothetical protein
MDQSFDYSPASAPQNADSIALGAGAFPAPHTEPAAPPHNFDDQTVRDSQRCAVVDAPAPRRGKSPRLKDVVAPTADAGTPPGQDFGAPHGTYAGRGTSSAGKAAPDDQTAGAPRVTSVVGGKKSTRQRSRAAPAVNASGEVLLDQHSEDTPALAVEEDTRFSDPLVLEIREMWRMRRRWLKARNALILQAKAFGRALSDGDKEQGTKIFDKVVAGVSDNPLAILAMSPFISGIERFDTELTKIERDLAKLAKKLPVAPWALSIRGFGFPSLAAIVGECGDLSAYRTVSGVWKRAGLAVIDGDGRQRRIADAEKALIHGYSPERRSALWNVAEPMARLQRTWLDKDTGEVKKPADPYGVILEREKAKALEAGCTPGHAEARAKRHMTKKFLRDLTVEWRRVAGRGGANVYERSGDSAPPLLIAAE